MIKNFIHLISFTKNLNRQLQLTPKWMFSKEKQCYIPVRPLKDDRTLIFTIGYIPKIRKIIPILIYTPFFSFMLQGLINDWSPLVVGGGIFTLIAGIAILRQLKKAISYEIIDLSVNKNVDLFFVKLRKTAFTLEITDQIHKKNKTSYEQLKRKWIEQSQMDEKQKKYLLTMDKNIFSWYIKLQRYLKKEIQLGLKREYIQKIQLLDWKQLSQKLQANQIKTKSSKIVQIFERYDTFKKNKNFLVFYTKPINNNYRFILYLDLTKNLQKKYEEYLYALGQDKVIINPIN